MKKILVYLISLIVALIIIIGAFLLSGLIFWGLGNLIIYLFKINCQWTFFHGLGVETILIIAKLIIREFK